MTAAKAKKRQRKSTVKTSLPKASVVKRPARRRYTAAELWDAEDAAFFNAIFEGIARQAK